MHWRLSLTARVSGKAGVILEVGGQRRGQKATGVMEASREPPTFAGEGIRCQADEAFHTLAMTQSTLYTAGKSSLERHA
jgi:hypothetical protein